ncbi:MAG: flagellar biosynthesis repressor FlbT [Pseudomonadota bacterium]
MSGLVLKLGPNERILVNGAVIENGDRRSRLSIKTPNANILRLRDAIRPEDATTPLRRACLAIQMVLSGESDPSEVRQANLRQIEELDRILPDIESLEVLTEAVDALKRDNHYQCLKHLRSLLSKESG